VSVLPTSNQKLKKKIKRKKKETVPKNGVDKQSTKAEVVFTQTMIPVRMLTHTVVIFFTSY